MKKRLFIIGVFIVCLIFGLGETKAEIDYKKNYNYYQKICSKRSSYELNKQACIDFENYKKRSDPEAEKMEKSLTDSKMNADKLASLINKNNALVAKKEKQIKENKQKIIENRKKVKELEKDVLNSLSTMQYFSNENQIIDIIMSSVSVEDLMTRIDGISTINKINITNIYEMEQLSKELDTEEKNLKEDIRKLNQTKEKQEAMLLEFRRKEADLYSNMNSGGSGAVYNDNIEKLDLSKINTKSKNWGRPSRSGVVTASTWYYPGGGWHPGIDVGIPVGTNVTAPGDGALLATANSGSGYGKHIVIVTKKGNYVYTMIFAHLSDFIGVNDFSKGQAIAKSGNTGASTGPHVHVEIFRHNTASVSTVVNQYRKAKDYWFGLGYSGKGDCNKVCRLQPADEFKLRMGQSY